MRKDPSGPTWTLASPSTRPGSPREPLVRLRVTATPPPRLSAKAERASRHLVLLVLQHHRHPRTPKSANPCSTSPPQCTMARDGQTAFAALTRTEDELRPCRLRLPPPLSVHYEHRISFHPQLLRCAELLSCKAQGCHLRREGSEPGERAWRPAATQGSL